MLDIVFEVLDNGSVRIELHHEWGVVVLCDVKTSKAQEIVLSAMVVILSTLASI